MSGVKTFSNETSERYALALFELANENSELEDIALEINSLDINNHLECYDTLSDIFNRPPLMSIRGSFLYLPNSERQSSISTGLLLDLNILVSKTLNSLEETDQEYSLSLLIELQEMCQQLVNQRIKRIKNDYNVKFLPNTQYNKMDFQKIPLEFIKLSNIGYLNTIKRKTFYIDFYNNNLFIMPKNGLFQKGKCEHFEQITG